VPSGAFLATGTRLLIRPDPRFPGRAVVAQTVSGVNAAGLLASVAIASIVCGLILLVMT
jgi:hypothetical protein